MRSSAPVEEVAAPALVPQPPAPADHRALLQQWISLADMQQRVIQVLVAEINQTSGFVEVEADSLSQCFQRLAVNAESQTARVDSLSALAIGVEVDGSVVPMVDIAALLGKTLGDVVQKITTLSKDAMDMVYALDELNANVARVDKCMEQLYAINRTTNMLALNARIEAERAGTAGAAFRVVAQEIRELSKATDDLAGAMQSELKTVTEGIHSGHTTLHRVANIDMSADYAARERLDTLLGALVHRTETLTSIVADAVREAEGIHADTRGMITGIQFQDRTRQRLEHVVDTLQVIGQGLERLKQETGAAEPGLDLHAELDRTWVNSLLERFTLGEMRARFVAQLLEGRSPAEAAPAAAAAPSESGSIELF